MTIGQNMPEVGYLVASDKLFIASYVLLLITLAQSVAQHVVEARGDSTRAEKLDARARWVFPALALAMFAYLITGALTHGA